MKSTDTWYPGVSVGYVPTYIRDIRWVKEPTESYRGVFGTASMPYRTLRWGSVRTRTRYRYSQRRWVRYDLNTCTRHLGQFGFYLNTGTRHFVMLGTHAQIYPGYRYALPNTPSHDSTLFIVDEGRTCLSLLVIKWKAHIAVGGGVPNMLPRT